MIKIASAQLSADINPLGAELSHLRDAEGRALMTDADPAFWTGRAPLLFPVIGSLNSGRYCLGGKVYALPQHGFARRMPFELVGSDDRAALFRLVDTAETRAVYPFAFALDANFTVEGATLFIDVTVTNTGDAPMPASFGFHPAFAWPLPYDRPRAEHRIVFDCDEPAKLNGIIDTLIGPADLPSPLHGRVLTLRDDLFDNDALVWSRIESRSVTYGVEAAPQLRIDFPDTPMLGIWTKPGAHFICIEPWHGQADPVGFAGEIWDKPGIMRFEPAQARTFRMSVTLTSQLIRPG